MLFCNYAYSTTIPYNFSVYTTIDKNSFFSYAITRFEFQPSSLLLNYNRNTKTFDEAFSNLMIETDIPQENTDLSLAIRMSENKTECTDFNQLVIDQSDKLAVIHLDEKLITLDTAVDFEFNKVIDNRKAAEYKTSIKFKSLPETAIDCRGSVTMLLEFSI